jgi:hypothetical protein
MKKLLMRVFEVLLPQSKKAASCGNPDRQITKSSGSIFPISIIMFQNFRATPKTLTWQAFQESRF